MRTAGGELLVVISSDLLSTARLRGCVPVEFAVVGTSAELNRRVAPLPAMPAPPSARPLGSEFQFAPQPAATPATAFGAASAEPARSGLTPGAPTGSDGAGTAAAASGSREPEAPPPAPGSCAGTPPVPPASAARLVPLQVLQREVHIMPGMPADLSSIVSNGELVRKMHAAVNVEIKVDEACYLPIVEWTDEKIKAQGHLGRFLNKALRTEVLQVYHLLRLAEASTDKAKFWSDLAVQQHGGSYVPKHWSALRTAAVAHGKRLADSKKVHWMDLVKELGPLPECGSE